MAGIPSLFAGIGAQLFDNSGNVLTGGKIFSYLAGTTTPVATYTTETTTAAHPNPIILDASGRVPSGGEIWLNEGDTTYYKFILKDANDVLIATYDYVPGTYSATNLANTTNTALGDALVGFRQSNSSGNLEGAVGRTVHQKLQEHISVKDFGAVGDGVTNDYAAFQAAYNGVPANATIFIPTGTYVCTPAITLSGTKRVCWITDTDTRWASNTDFANVFIEYIQAGTANLFRSNLGYADYNQGAGGLRMDQIVRGVTNTPNNYEFNGYRLSIQHKDPSFGQSWGDGQGVPNILRSAIGQTIFAYVDSTNPKGSLWAQNLNVSIQNGGDGTLRACTIVLDNDGGREVPGPMAPFSKHGITMSTKTLLGTSGISIFKGAGAGWYKGYFVENDAIVNDANDGRAFEFTGKFEVMPDGTTLVGKSNNSIFQNGVTITPDGTVNATSTGTPSIVSINRAGTLTTAENIGQIVARGINSAGAGRIFGRILFQASNPTSGSEEGRIYFATMIAGTDEVRGFIENGLVLGVATGADKGAGTINVSGGLYLNGTAYTNPDYVFEKAYTGKIEKFANKIGADTYETKSIEEVEQYTKDNLALPGFGQDANLDYLGGSEMVLARLEEAYLHIFELNKRIKALEEK